MSGCVRTAIYTTVLGHGTSVEGMNAGWWQLWCNWWDQDVVQRNQSEDKAPYKCNTANLNWPLFLWDLFSELHFNCKYLNRTSACHLRCNFRFGIQITKHIYETHILPGLTLAEDLFNKKTRAAAPVMPFYLQCVIKPFCINGPIRKNVYSQQLMKAYVHHFQ